MDEKRKFMRFRTPMEFNFDLPLGDGCLGKIKDISMGGAKAVLDSELELALDSEITMDFNLSQETVQISGQIVWLKKHDDRLEAGVRFLDQKNDGKDKLNTYIFHASSQELSRDWWQM